jgi:hypothetical protein
VDGIACSAHGSWRRSERTDLVDFFDGKISEAMDAAITGFEERIVNKTKRILSNATMRVLNSTIEDIDPAIEMFTPS